jgi:hypothetical protein
VPSACSDGPSISLAIDAGITALYFLRSSYGRVVVHVVYTVDQASAA